MLLLVILVSSLGLAALPPSYGNVTRPDVSCSSKIQCVTKPGDRCTIRQGFVTLSTVTGPVKKCAAPMTCLRDWKTEDEGVCVRNAAGMPCLMNNFLGGCSTLATEPNAYCLEGRCHRPPAFPGDHCWVAGECTSGATCENRVCKGIPEGGLCTNQFRLCDRGLYCPNAPPGHAKCTRQKKVGEMCQRDLSIVTVLSGILGVNECEPGAHCLHNRCVRNSDVRAKLGENCTGHLIVGHMERLCENDLYCRRSDNTCAKWPANIWAPCDDDTQCGDGMVCNCKVGGIQVCEVPGEEGLALYDFVHGASEKVTSCIEKHKCWQGRSQYPRNTFNDHSCAWINCRKEMAQEMHDKYCADKALPEYRDCVMHDWCKDLMAWTKVNKATPPPATPAPEDLVERLSPVQISAIVVGSLALTLLVFFSGFIVGWVRQKYQSWRGAGGSGESGVEFSNLQSLVSEDPTLD